MNKLQRQIKDQRLKIFKYGFVATASKCVKLKKFNGHKCKAKKFQVKKLSHNNFT